MYEWTALDQALIGAECLINATTLGLEGGEALTISLDGLKPGAVVMDMVYRPLQTPLLKHAAAAGLIAVDGLSMLIGQAMPSFDALFGRSPPADVDARAMALAALGSTA